MHLKYLIYRSYMWLFIFINYCCFFGSLASVCCHLVTLSDGFNSQFIRKIVFFGLPRRIMFVFLFSFLLSQKYTHIHMLAIVSTILCTWCLLAWSLFVFLAPRYNPFSMCSTFAFSYVVFDVPEGLEVFEVLKWVNTICFTSPRD